MKKPRLLTIYENSRFGEKGFPANKTGMSDLDLLMSCIERVGRGLSITKLSAELNIPTHSLSNGMSAILGMTNQREKFSKGSSVVKPLQNLAIRREIFAEFASVRSYLTEQKKLKTVRAEHDPVGELEMQISVLAREHESAQFDLRRARDQHQKAVIKLSELSAELAGVRTAYNQANEELVRLRRAHQALELTLLKVESEKAPKSQSRLFGRIRRVFAI